MPEDMAPEVAERGRLAFVDTATIRDMPRIHAVLCDALSANQELTIDCAAVTEIDLSFIQLILSARKSAAAAGKRIAVIPPDGTLLTDLLVRAGLLASAEETRSGEQSFWFDKV